MLFLTQAIAIRGYPQKDSNNFSTSTLQEINAFPDTKILLFHAPWCPDCQKTVPEFAQISKILQHNVIPVKLDRNKQDKDGIAKKYKIGNVPTVVVHGNGKRCKIVEKYDESWESDILACLQAIWPQK